MKRIRLFCIVAIIFATGGLIFSAQPSACQTAQNVDEGEAQKDGPASSKTGTLTVTFSDDGMPIFPAVTPEEVVAMERFKKADDVLMDTLLNADLYITPKSFKVFTGYRASEQCETKLAANMPGIYKGKKWMAPNRGYQHFLLKDDAIIRNLGLADAKRQKGKETHIVSGDGEERGSNIWNAVISAYITVLGNNTIYTEWRAYPQEDARRLCIRTYNHAPKRDNESWNDLYNRLVAKKAGEKCAIIYEQIKNKNTVKAYEAFIARYPNAPAVKDAKIEIAHQLFPDVVKENNIAGYAWFINTYPDSPLIKEALQKMYQAAFEVAAKENTVEAYNDFIVAFPLALQTKQASDAAYNLEANLYKVGFFIGSPEKNSRAILVKSMQFYSKALRSDDARKNGYLMIVERMNRLLENMFPAEQATVDHLRSGEFRAFHNDLKNSLSSIKSSLDAIQGDVAKVASLLSEQTAVMDRHFQEAAQSQKMSDELTRQHRLWERYEKKI